MNRENRYIVLKVVDVDKSLTSTETDILSILLSKVSKHRFMSGKELLQCVVVEHDWPEYEPTWKMISERVDNDNSIS